MPIRKHVLRLRKDILRGFEALVVSKQQRLLLFIFCKMSETYAYRVKLDRSAKNNGQTYFDNMSEQFLALLRKYEVCFYAYYEHC